MESEAVIKFRVDQLLEVFDVARRDIGIERDLERAVIGFKHRDLIVDRCVVGTGECENAQQKNDEKFVREFHSVVVWFTLEFLLQNVIDRLRVGLAAG